MSRRQTILGVIEDLVGKFLYYDRKESESLPLGEIEKAVMEGEITVEEMTEKFAEEINSCFQNSM